MASTEHESGSCVGASDGESVGANDDDQKADFGEVMRSLHVGESDEFAEQISRVERDLLWAHHRGLRVPPYVARAFREAVELAQVRRG